MFMEDDPPFYYLPDRLTAFFLILIDLFFDCIQTLIDRLLIALASPFGLKLAAGDIYFFDCDLVSLFIVLVDL